MNCKLQTAILLILSLLFAQSGFAQDDNADISLEKLEIVTEDKTVNNMIDEVVNDYLIKEEIQNSVLDLSGPEEKNNSWVKSGTSMRVLRDRELSIKFSKRGNGADLRVLDKIYGTSEKVKVLENSSTSYGNISVSLHSCFYEKEGSQGESIALINITDGLQGNSVYNNWFSTAYSNLTNFNNHRYSMWLLSCSSSGQE